MSLLLFHPENVHRDDFPVEHLALSPVIGPDAVRKRAVHSKAPR